MINTIKSKSADEQMQSAQMMRLFRCSQRSFATWSPATLHPDEKGKLVPKYVTERRAITIADWDAHLRGQRTVVVPLRCDDDTTQVPLLDVHACRESRRPGDRAANRRPHHSAGLAEIRGTTSGLHNRPRNQAYAR